MNRGWSRLLHSEHGASAVEFALILPLLILLLFGLFEVGRMFWTCNIVSASVRDAARYAARVDMNCGGFANGADTANTQRLARTGTIDVGGTPVIQNWTNNASVAVNISCVSNASGTYLGIYEGAAQIPRVEVTAAAPFQTSFLSLLPGLNLGTISVSHAEVWTQ